jgi:acetylornithine deacetylase/succinyl-diaminopimelate desuccinylase-like protein/gamma-glutamyl:cysteine ligase YbdK (ATP-grasp superfamily)
MYEPFRFAEKYQLAWQSALEEKPKGGLCGFELEWNMLDSEMRPLVTVGLGPNQHSFVDYLRDKKLSAWVREYSQLEVFHWMIEWATKPYYHPRGAVYEGRLLEASLLNVLDKAGREFGERLYAWHGNLLFLTDIGRGSIPFSWHLAKRRYLERCVELFGSSLATAGTHTNLSLPDSLLMWDFMHLPASERGDTHLDEYKSQFYITATRLMRAFAALFIATSAATPMQPQVRDGKPVVVLTEYDAVRNLTFPNPEEIDLPNLYRSYEDYLQISYDLVRRGVRFGNNNWTPVRARSFAEPVERLIAVTSDQLGDLYARGLYAAGGQTITVDDMARQIEIQNLMARINIPMSRVEVRTDDGGHSLEIDVANLTLKHLLLLRFYADSEFARAFRYDREDISRARRNEVLAAQDGLRGEIENPLTGKPVGMREFLGWTLDELRPLGEALGLWEDVTPLIDMAAGGPNTAEKMRQRIASELGGGDEVPLDLLKTLAEEREQMVDRDIEYIAAVYSSLAGESNKLGDFIQRARDEVRLDPQTPIRFRPRREALVEMVYPDKTSEILALAQELIRIPSVTAAPIERLDEIHRAGTYIFDYLRNNGLGVRYYNHEKYPAILAGFPGEMEAPVMLSGHFDVVSPEPDDNQFDPYVEGDYLWGRGSADMKTVVATYLVWMKDSLLSGTPYPPINLLLVGNEENGESDPMGTPHVLKLLSDDDGYAPKLLIAGERTGEKGNELWGEICIENRGVMRFDVIGRGQREHSALAGRQADLMERLLSARAAITGMLSQHLTLSSPDGWQSQVRFPFVQVGNPGVYNVTADYGVVGVEVRPIPQDHPEILISAINSYCESHSLELQISVMENGIACSPDNPYLKSLIRAVNEISGSEARLGRKLPGTSARFAPGGQGVVWGQTGIGPHAKDERHYIPSIMPYYQALDRLGALLR